MLKHTKGGSGILKRFILSASMFLLVCLIVASSSPIFRADGENMPLEETTAAEDNATQNNETNAPEDGGSTPETPPSNEVTNGGETGNDNVVASDDSSKSESTSDITSTSNSASTSTDNDVSSSTSVSNSTSSSSSASSSNSASDSLSGSLIEEEEEEVQLLIVPDFGPVAPPLGYEGYTAKAVMTYEDLQGILTQKTKDIKGKEVKVPPDHPYYVDKNVGDLYIYLWADITIPEKNGTKIIDQFKNLVVDGMENRLDDTIRADNGENSQTIHTTHGMNITAKNMKSNCYNHYGIFHAIQGTKGVSINYENITFTGRQLVHNLDGAVTIDNSVINITFMDNGRTGLEAVEAMYVYLKGEVTIDQTNAQDVHEVFWLWGSGGIYVEPGAKVKIIGNKVPCHPTADVLHKGYRNERKNFLAYNLLDWDFELKDGATLILDIDRGFEETDHLRNFTVGKNAIFEMTVASQSKTIKGHIDARKNISIGDGSRFIINSNHDLPDIGPKKDIGGSSPGIKLSGGKLTISNPDLLYVSGKAISKPIEMSDTGSLEIFAQQLNVWRSREGNNLSILDTSKGRYVAADARGNPCQANVFYFTGKWSDIKRNRVFPSNASVVMPVNWSFSDYNPASDVFALGRQNLTLGEYTFPAETYKGGTTNPNSKLRITYKDLTLKEQKIDGASGDSKEKMVEYSITLPEKIDERIQPNSDFTVTSLKEFLFWQEKKTANVGMLDLKVDPLDYGSNNYLSALPERIYVSEDVWNMMVEDTRGAGKEFKQWNLSVKMTGYLDSGSHVLQDVVRVNLPLRDRKSLVTNLDGSNYRKKVEIDVGPSTWEYQTQYLGEKNKNGIFLEVPTGSAYAETYTGTVTWTLENAP